MILNKETLENREMDVCICNSRFKTGKFYKIKFGCIEKQVKSYFLCEIVVQILGHELLFCQPLNIL